jgi:hypothetical protein
MKGAVLILAIWSGVIFYGICCQLGGPPAW